MNAMLANGPRSDRNIACSSSRNLGQNHMVMVMLLNRGASFLLLPHTWLTGVFLVTTGCKWASFSQLSPQWPLEPCSFQDSCTLQNCLD